MCEFEIINPPPPSKQWPAIGPVAVIGCHELKRGVHERASSSSCFHQSVSITMFQCVPPGKRALVITTESYNRICKINVGINCWKSVPLVPLPLLYATCLPLPVSINGSLTNCVLSLYFLWEKSLRSMKEGIFFFTKMGICKLHRNLFYSWTSSLDAQNQAVILLWICLVGIQLCCLLVRNQWKGTDLSALPFILALGLDTVNFRGISCE